MDYFKESVGLDSQKFSSHLKSFALNEKPNNLIFDDILVGDIINDTTLSDEIRFSAWYSLFLSMRRMKTATQKITKLIEGYKEEFSQFELYKIAAAIVLAKQQEYSDALTLAESVLSQDTTNLGYIATYVDIAISWASSSYPGKSIDDTVWYKTKRLLNFLIDQEPTYAKYQFLFSQFLLCEKNLEEAERRILLAIDFEEEKTSDYLIKLSDYQAHYLKVRAAVLEKGLVDEIKILTDTNRKLQSDQLEFRAEMKSVKEELKDNQRQSFQFITIFVAVISILLSSIKALSFTDTRQLVQFMIIMTLSLLLFFSTLFGLISVGKVEHRVALVVLGVVSSIFLLYHVA
ncbi:hypothetical protein CWC31_07210 [Pseudoalteromonas ruthenica]|uniref:hypothetical protein n=1 Tax=Pseudoalteromonas ruthenica TaxID=151081 RepID=UPI0011081418|nr:hypothetical protein [Pseudoalteromonas ruthenica]TLX51393.1 hypothetical protein CWC31_07210 [Pseudoalteromonas ruthenica]